MAAVMPRLASSLLQQLIQIVILCMAVVAVVVTSVVEMSNDCNGVDFLPSVL